MAQDTSSVVAVQRFAGALREIRGRLLHDLFPVPDIADLLSGVRSRRDLPREGVTSSGIEYTVHGAGCRIAAPDGRQVDVDLVTDPATGDRLEAFDAWRIRWFLDEAAQDGYSNEEIEAACAYLAREGALREVVAGLYRSITQFRLRGLGILVDQPVEDASAAYPYGGQIRDRCWGHVDGWWELLAALVGSVLVVVPDVLFERDEQMSRVVDQDPIEALPAYRAHPPLGVGVRAGSPRRRPDDLDALSSEHLVERGGVLGVTVPDQEPER
jgi:hypothetical protein